MRQRDSCLVKYLHRLSSSNVSMRNTMVYLDISEEANASSQSDRPTRLNSFEDCSNGLNSLWNSAYQPRQKFFAAEGEILCKNHSMHLLQNRIKLILSHHCNTSSHHHLHSPCNMSHLHTPLHLLLRGLSQDCGLTHEAEHCVQVNKKHDIVSVTKPTAQQNGLKQ